MVERRTRRSEIPLVALRLYLESLAEKSGASAVALADGAGRLIAGFGEGATGLAAAAPAFARGEEPALPPSLADDADVYTRQVQVHGAPWTLASVGARIRRLHLATAGIERILPA